MCACSTSGGFLTDMFSLVSVLLNTLKISKVKPAFALLTEIPYFHHGFYIVYHCHSFIHIILLRPSLLQWFNDTRLKKLAPPAVHLDNPTPNGKWTALI